MSGFHEVRFPDNIAYAATGGPEFATTVVATGSGHEKRNVNWAQARGRWDVASGLKKQTRRCLAPIPSPDGNYHVCEYAGTIRCFFQPRQVKRDPLEGAKEPDDLDLAQWGALPSSSNLTHACGLSPTDDLRTCGMRGVPGREFRLALLGE
jgi:hypothetical protein